MHRIIDCHALIASSDRVRYPLDPAAAPPAPGEIEAMLSDEGLVAALAEGVVAGAVLVQRGRLYGSDCRLILDIAERDPRLRAIVAVDPDADGAAARGRQLLDAPGVAGLRFMEPVKGAPLSWLGGEGARSLWRIAAERGAIVDVHVFPWSREAALLLLAALLAEFPGVPVLLDNLGAAAVEQGAPDFGFDARLGALCEYPGLTLKFSGMTLARLARAEIDAAAAIVRVAAAVGAERLCWGSDLLAPGVDLASAVADARTAVAALSDDDRDAVLYRNAARLFGFAT